MTLIYLALRTHLNFPQSHTETICHYIYYLCRNSVAPIVAPSVNRPFLALMTDLYFPQSPTETICRDI